MSSSSVDIVTERSRCTSNFRKNNKSNVIVSIARLHFHSLHISIRRAITGMDYVDIAVRN